MKNLYIVFSQENNIICIIEDKDNKELIQEKVKAFYDLEEVEEITVEQNWNDAINHMSYRVKGIELSDEVEYVIRLEQSYLAKQLVDGNFLEGFKKLINPKPINKEIRDLFISMGCNIESTGNAEVLNFNQMAAPIFIYEP